MLLGSSSYIPVSTTKVNSNLICLNTDELPLLMANIELLDNLSKLKTTPMEKYITFFKLHDELELPIRNEKEDGMKEFRKEYFGENSG